MTVKKLATNIGASIKSSLPPQESAGRFREDTQTRDNAEFFQVGSHFVSEEKMEGQENGFIRIDWAFAAD